MLPHACGYAPAYATPGAFKIGSLTAPRSTAYGASCVGSIVLFLRDTIACRRCLGLDYASRHLRRQTPGVGRVERLWRKLGDCEPKPFAPLPVRIRRGRSRAYHDKLVARILDEDTAAFALRRARKIVRGLRLN